jgi:hypothetical protein
MSIIYKPSKKDKDELINERKRLVIKLIESKKKLDVLKDFKERTGLKGQELKKSFEEYWNNGNPKETKSEEPKPKKGRPKKKSEEEQAEVSNNFQKMMLDKISQIKKRNIEIDKELKENAKIREHLKRNTKNGTNLDYDDLLLFEKNELNLNDDWESEEESLKEVIKNTYKESNIMKCRSDLKKLKNGKMCIETEININNDIDDKVKRALLKSIIEELNKNFYEYEFFYQKKN